MIAYMMAMSPIVLAGLFLLFLKVSGRSIQISKVKLPFVEMSLRRFDGLAPVQLFDQVSIELFPETSLEGTTLETVATHTQLIEEANPILLIHLGWSIVCKSFVDIYHNYPDDENINNAAREIGGQNVEFIKMYRDINNLAIQDVTSVKRTFAVNYLLRAPALVQRISGRLIMKEAIKDQYIQEILTAANTYLKQKSK